ncbi:MAG: hypothetical protein J5636_00920 [Clostridiales bacterium]|nr:hypothetical protein [Clostridiales bacterium]
MKNSVRKTLASAFAFTMMMSLVACGEDESETSRKLQKKDNTSTTIESVIETPVETKEPESYAPSETDEPNLTLPSDANITETTETTTEPVDGYTYVVYEGTEYETTFTLSVNIDDYISSVETSEYLKFDLRQLSKDLGWTLWHQYGEPASEETSNGYLLTYLDETNNIETMFNFTNEPYDDNQLYTCSVHFYTPSLEKDFYDEGDISGQPEYYNSIIKMSRHDCVYFLSGIKGTPQVSRDDIVIIAYIMTFVKDDPGKNPLYFTSLQNKCSTGNGDFKLP